MHIYMYVPIIMYGLWLYCCFTRTTLKCLFHGCYGYLTVCKVLFLNSVWLLLANLHDPFTQRPFVIIITLQCSPVHVHSLGVYDRVHSSVLLLQSVCLSVCLSVIYLIDCLPVCWSIMMNYGTYICAKWVYPNTYAYIT